MSTEISDKSYKALNRDTIKYIAMFTMLLNHIATIFLTPGTWLFELFLAIGYFTAITMIYFLVEGYHYTHSKKTYISRLFVFALISEIPYCLAFTTNGVMAFYGLPLPDNFLNISGHAPRHDRFFCFIAFPAPAA